MKIVTAAKEVKVPRPKSKDQPLRGSRRNSHSYNARQRNSLYLTVFTHHNYLTILNCDAAHAVHVAVDERTVVCFNYQARASILRFLSWQVACQRGEQLCSSWLVAFLWRVS